MVASGAPIDEGRASFANRNWRGSPEALQDRPARQRSKSSSQAKTALLPTPAPSYADGLDNLAPTPERSAIALWMLRRFGTPAQNLAYRANEYSTAFFPARPFRRGDVGDGCDNRQRGGIIRGPREKGGVRVGGDVVGEVDVVLGVVEAMEVAAVLEVVAG